MVAIEDRSAPGTLQLIDTTGELHVKHSEAAQDIVLIPVPSDDPEDPLNWSRRRKLLHTSCMVIYTVMMVFPSSAVYSVTTPISKATELKVSDLVSGTGAMFLLYGWGCIVWQALALQYGKRPAYLISMAVSTVLMGVTPLCVTNGPYLAVKILQGFFGAPVESLCEISMTDIWFSHERPLFLAVYGLSLAFSGKFAPVFAAFINTGQGWEWTLWWCAIGMGVAFVYCFFLMEETNYDRKLQSLDTSAVSSTAVIGEVVDSTTPSEKSSSEKAPAFKADHAAVEAGQAAYPRKTYWQKLSVIDKKRPNRVLEIMWAPFKFFTFPVITWAGFMYGTNALVWPGILNATASPTYTKVYGFNSNEVGFAYFGAVVGMVLGSLWVTFAGPQLVVRLARRNRGVAEPEHILWLFLASLLAVPFAMLLWGLGGAADIHWFGMVLAQCVLAISSTLCLSTAIQYATSAYRDLSGEHITTIVLIRNTLSFAINYGITPWINAQGQRDTFITVAVLAGVCNASMLPMIWRGKKLRMRSADTYWRWVEAARAKGLSH
ncbi:major facilitator superfamily transporter [Drepanopeziza brunnea f. sp. 'multigermtubi' MB_m1]|uniref:Major facilitator superfamily transporter n=1 Tax=Marssonina brunnea f. sp. multigermtubi (strain MB_m1) TaxID=1072389 RepID=K1WVT8_MARBU|nr:major facilitator superfamily transporter [Drepanopeziza brunnea f. sp. 'multigermtubi' MB_m1]EKD21760.1 major facilitator superfamily transporter [Drepanopeziza brunnea f. sp. 'multigermtubi' MB_m1]